ncbi:MAG: OmpA family protein [Acidobacteria bacterium]|nr:OmpA family protein [Acidobacteriota bacterium]
MGRRRKEEEHENHERWLVSYADFITLLFAFFTTLYAISTVDAQKMGQMVYSMKQSFDPGMFESGGSSIMPGGGGEGSTPSAEVISKINMQAGLELREAILTRSGVSGSVLSGKKDLNKLKRSIESLLGSDKDKSAVHVTVDPRGLTLSLGEGGFFDSGSEILKPEGRILLDTLATTLISVDNMIRIEGHTDTDPINNEKFASNMELSAARATKIHSYLVEKFGFRPELLSTAGYGEYRPVAPNDTAEGKARNRRVDIVVLDPKVTGSEPRSILDAAGNSAKAE